MLIGRCIWTISIWVLEVTIAGHLLYIPSIWYCRNLMSSQSVFVHSLKIGLLQNLFAHSWKRSSQSRLGNFQCLQQHCWNIGPSSLSQLTIIRFLLFNNHEMGISICIVTTLEFFDGWDFIGSKRVIKAWSMLLGCWMMKLPLLSLWV